MSIIKPDLRVSLETLRETRLALISNPSSETHQPFYCALKQATELLGDAENRVIATAIACYWLDHFASTLVNAVNHFPYKQDIDAFVALIVRNKIVKDLTQNARAEKVLACVCVSRVLLTSEGLAHSAHAHPAHQNVGDLLEQWIDGKVDDAALESVPIIADLIYGTGVWALYGADVQWPEDSPSYLYSLNLPVLHKEIVPAAHTSATQDLPTDMLP